MHWHYYLLSAHVSTDVLFILKDAILLRKHILLHIHWHIMSGRYECQHVAIRLLFLAFHIAVKYELLHHSLILFAFLFDCSVWDLVANWCRPYYILIQKYGVWLRPISSDDHLVLLWNNLRLLNAYKLIEQLLFGNIWVQHVFRFLLSHYLLVHFVLDCLGSHIGVVYF